jgi:hypothetical protein
MKEATMAVTTSGAYLMLARYNRAKWNGLKKPAEAALEVGTDVPPAEPQIDEQEQAHAQAMIIFPKDNYPVPQLTPEERNNLLPPYDPEKPPPDLKGVRMLHSFHTNMFAWLHEKIPNIGEPDANGTVEPPPEEGGTTPPVDGGATPPKKSSQIVDEMMMSGGTEYDDPGIGWLAVVDKSDFPAFIEHMGGKAGPLWRMYDIEIIPLNQDQTTWDVYNFMTPVNWSK